LPWPEEVYLGIARNFFQQETQLQNQTQVFALTRVALEIQNKAVSLSASYSISSGAQIMPTPSNYFELMAAFDKLHASKIQK